ncbi:hypothetical protein DID77_04405 [Candidatus Marinamargulisbacteria bacterium SCGC AG-439-L15]|nr:hypothetical protein DID77_04405 [Candidatus Marinamargulisbacteria bacterium SCGC AG-439-L15]
MNIEQGLFQVSEKESPLAYRLAPKSFDAYLGHDDILGEGKPLRILIENDDLVSMILWGPPGCGKTALSRVIAEKSQANYIALNAVMSKVSDIRDAIATASSERELGKKTILFIDEIHRFNKAQQDALLPDLEKGTVILIGATTENPYFSVNASVISRCQMIALKSLSTSALMSLLETALVALESVGLLTDDAKTYVVSQAQGDARRLLNMIELCHKTYPPEIYPVEKDVIQNQLTTQGISHTDDAHYDLSSALIKSIRGSDPDAALYWLARLIKGGEDPRFIARRLIILASEDIGNADPQALVLATSLLQAVQFVGLPEAQLNLSQVVSYLATAPKSNASTVAISKAMTVINQGEVYPVPLELRDAHYKGAKDLGHGDGYQYAHDEVDGVSSQTHMPKRHRFYQPVDRGFEKTIQKRLDYINRKRYP